MTMKSRLNREATRRIEKQRKKEIKMFIKAKDKKEEKLMTCKQRIEDDYVNNRKIRTNIDDVSFMVSGGKHLTKAMCHHLSEIGINKISQLQHLATMERTVAYTRLNEADGFGNATSELALLASELYILVENIAKDKEAEIKAEKETETATESTPESIPAVVEEKEEKKEEQKPVETVEADGVNLSTDLMELVFDLAAHEKNVGIIEFDPTGTHKVGGDDIIFNVGNLLVEEEFLRKEFSKMLKSSKKYSGIKDKYNANKYFMEALKGLESYIKVSLNKYGKKFYFTRKDYLNNNKNYVQIDIKSAEDMMNLKLKFSACKKALRHAEDTEAVYALNGSTMTFQTPAPNNMEIVNNKTIPRNLVKDTFKNPKVDVDTSKQDTKVDPGTGNNVTKSIRKEGKNMTTSKIIVNPIKGSEFVPGTGVVAFDILIKKSTPVASNIDKLNFDFTANKPDLAEQQYEHKGVAMYIYDVKLPREGFYFIPKELKNSGYEADIRYQILQFINGQ
jgi:hypothetical protein